MTKDSINFSRPGLSADISVNDGLSLQFDNRRNSIMRISTVNLGGFSEKDSRIKKFRRHHTIDGLSTSVETLATIPFGIEPEISRNIEFAANHARVITDLSMKSGMPVKHIDVDNIGISGNIRRVAVAAIPADGGSLPEIQWRECQNPEMSFYDSASPFLFCLVEMNDGFIWEIGSGDDLWRWSCAERHQADSHFSVTLEGSVLHIRRQVYIKREESAVPQRGLRFKWYFAWTHPEKQPSCPDTVTAAPFAAESAGDTFDLAKNQLPDTAMVFGNDGKAVNAPCFQAHATLKRFKSWIRSVAGNNDTRRQLRLLNTTPHICMSASHLDRANKKILPHWDIMSLMDQWLWANRHLNKFNAGISFLPGTEENAGQLPSCSGLSINISAENPAWEKKS